MRGTCTAFGLLAPQPANRVRMRGEAAMERAANGGAGALLGRVALGPPEAHGVVVGGRGQHVVVHGVPGHGVHAARVPQHHRDGLLALHVPDVHLRHKDTSTDRDKRGWGVVRRRTLLSSLPEATKSWCAPPKQAWMVKWPCERPRKRRTRARARMSHRCTPWLATFSSSSESAAFTHIAITACSSWILHNLRVSRRHNKTLIVRRLSSCV